MILSVNGQTYNVMQSMILFAFSIVMTKPSYCQFRVYVSTNFMTIYRRAGEKFPHCKQALRRKMDATKLQCCTCEIFPYPNHEDSVKPRIMPS